MSYKTNSGEEVIDLREDKVQKESFVFEATEPPRIEIDEELDKKLRKLAKQNVINQRNLIIHAIAIIVCISILSVLPDALSTVVPFNVVRLLNSIFIIPSVALIGGLAIHAAWFFTTRNGDSGRIDKEYKRLKKSYIKKS